MKKIITLTLFGSLFFAPSLLNAQDSTQNKRKVAKEKIKNATPEQKEKAKEVVEKRKERIANMTPEEKAKYEAKKQAAKEKVKNMTPEEKDKLKDKIKERREKRKG